MQDTNTALNTQRAKTPEGYSTSDPERKPIRSGTKAVKEAVPIERVAAEYTVLQRVGDGLAGICPLPNHSGKGPDGKERTPSFYVYPEKGRFKCYGCQMFGDVIDLEELAGKHAEVWTAMIALSVRYGVELPSRSETWKRWQGEKLAIEDLAENVRFQVRCRRLFKLLILNAPEIQSIEDPDERREEVQACYEAFQEGLREINHKAKRKMMGRLG